MIELAKIDFKKLASYRTFWIICGIYFFVLGAAAGSGMEVIKWLEGIFHSFGYPVSLDRIPIYHFPDIWMNLVWCAGWLKIVLGIMVVISITNEFSYRTVRQNIIDGLSRWEFLVSKIMTNVMLSILSVGLIFIIALIAGLIYSPSLVWDRVITDMEFIPAYFLEIFMYLSYALFLGILIRRSGLTIILLLVLKPVELFFIYKVLNLDGYAPGAIDFFPLQALGDLVPIPFPRYAFQEIQDYVKASTVMIVLGWIVLFNYLSYLRLKKSDL